MTCDDFRRQLLVRPTREYADILRHHPCAACEALARRLTEEENAMYATVTDWISQPLAPTRTRARRWPVVLLAAAAIGALWIAATGRPEAEPRASLGVVPAVPKPAPTGTIEVLRGASVMLSTPRTVVKIGVDAPGVAATLIGEDRVLVAGLALGARAILRIDLVGNEKPLLYQVDVGPERTVLPDANDEANLSLKMGEVAPIAIHDPPFDVRTTDPSIATVGRRGNELVVDVTGHRAGIVDLWIVYPDGPPDVWAVQITP